MSTSSLPPTPRTVAALLATGRGALASAGIANPGEEARLLLAHRLAVSTAWIMAHPEAAVPADQEEGYLSWVARRTAHEPVAYILGHKEFYGIDLRVNPAVLIPRPETELLVEAILASYKRIVAAGVRSPRAVDLGTGSGAVAIAVASNAPAIRIVAIDLSVEALAVARDNADRYGLTDRIRFLHGDLLSGFTNSFSILMANLPYGLSGEFDSLMPDVRDYEPRSAIAGGATGTEITVKAMEETVDLIERPGALHFEIGEGQGTALAEVARRLYPDATIQVKNDYAGLERILSIELD